jgi:predicted metal-dependent hydrolase
MHAQQGLRKRVAYWVTHLKVQPTRIVIRDMKRKWASCSRHGQITLSRDVAILPPRLRDYVVVHELLHLRVANHGRLFKAYLSATLPGWRHLQHELSRHDRQILTRKWVD